MRSHILLLTFTIAWGLLFPRASLAKRVLLKTPTAFNTNLLAIGSVILYVKDRVEKASRGALRFKIYGPKKLVAPFEILDAVSTGKVSAGYAISGYWQGKIPAAPVFSSLPFGPEIAEFMAWLKFGNGGKLYQEMYDKYGYQVKVIPCGAFTPDSSGWYSREIKTLADLKGLKIRFYGLGGEVMKKLGASPSLIPGGEIFPALERKVLDATEYSMPAIDEKLGFYRVAKYNYFPGWHQQGTVFELLINKGVWSSLEKSQQALIQLACEGASLQSIAEGEALQFKAMERMRARGVQIKRWPEEMLAAFRKAWDEVAREMMKKDPFFKRAYLDLKEFRKGHQLWRDNAYLPRVRGQP